MPRILAMACEECGTATTFHDAMFVVVKRKDSRKLRTYVLCPSCCDKLVVVAGEHGNVHRAASSQGVES